MRAPRSKLRAVAHTVEDAEGLLNSLLLLTVLMLAFAVNQTTAIFSLEDFLEADKREKHGRIMVVLEFERTAGDNQGRRLGARSHLSLLHHYGLLNWSILLLVAALVLGVISYISLCYSDARESPREQIPDDVVEGAPLDHGSCMACLPCAGTFCFLRAMHFALEISAPRYTSFTIVNGTVSEPASQDLTFVITLAEGNHLNTGIIWLIIVTAVLGIIL